MDNRADTPDEVLMLAIDEQRRVYDMLATLWAQLRVKCFTFLGGGLTALTFLYASTNNKDQLFIPNETYGQILYFAALGVTIFGLVSLFLAIKPSHWEFPTEKHDLLKLHYATQRSYLEYTKDRYITCYDVNSKAYEYKQRLFNLGLYPLIFGVIILIVLKLFRSTT